MTTNSCRNGRDWGTCNGACGAVETFKACADISILAENTNYTTTERPSTTESVQTTTTSNSNGETTDNSNGGTTSDNSNNNGDQCRAIGAWSGQAAVDAWCTDNCLAATPYRPGKNGFSKQHNTRSSGPADSIYIFYQRLWPGQIANTKSTLTLALGLWSHLCD